MVQLYQKGVINKTKRSKTNLQDQTMVLCWVCSLLNDCFPCFLSFFMPFLAALLNCPESLPQILCFQFPPPFIPSFLPHQQSRHICLNEQEIHLYRLHLVLILSRSVYTRHPLLDATEQTKRQQQKLPLQFPLLHSNVFISRALKVTSNL